MTASISPPCLSAGGHNRSPLATLLKSIPLWAVLTWWCFLSLAAADPLDSAGDQILKPLHIDDFEIVTGLSKRSESSEFDFMSPAELANLAFGSPQGENGTMMLANMTLYAPENLPVVLMERFEGVASAVDCEGEDGKLSITFKSPAAFDHAKKTWSYLNDDDDAEVLIITNHDGCGPEDQREIYRVSKVDAVKKTLTVYMFAEAAEWNKVVGNFHMDFGQAEMTPKEAQRLRIRGLGDVFAPVEKRDPALTKHLEKRGTIDTGGSFSIGTEGREFTVFRDITRFPPRLTMECKNCFARISFRMVGKLILEWFKLTECSLSLTVKEFRTVFEFLYKIVAEKDTLETDDPAVPLKKEFKKFQTPGGDTGYEIVPPFPLPGLGFTIPRVLELGLTASITTHFEVQYFGRVSFATGTVGYIPEDSHMFIDFLNPKNNRVVGFKGSRFDWNDEVRKGVFEGVATAWGAPKLSLGIKLSELGSSNAEVLFKMPQVRLNITTGCEENFCKEATPLAPNHGGVKFTADISVSLWFRLSPFNVKFIKLPKGISNLKHLIQYAPFQYMIADMEWCKPWSNQKVCADEAAELFPPLPPPKEGEPPKPEPPKPEPPKLEPPKPPPKEGCKVDGRAGICIEELPNGDGCKGGYWAPGEGPPWPCSGLTVCCIMGKPPRPTDEKCEVDGRSGFCREKKPDGSGCDNGYFAPGNRLDWPCRGKANKQCCIRGFSSPPKDKPPAPPPTKKCESPLGEGQCIPRGKCRGRAYAEPLCPGQPEDIQCCVQSPCEGPDPMPAPFLIGKPSIQKGWCRHKSQGCNGKSGEAPLPMGGRYEWREKNGDAFSCPEEDEDTKCCVALNS